MDAIILDHPECEITLHALSLIRTSINFWEQSEIKQEIRNYFSNNDEDSWKPETWHKITHKVLGLAESPGIVPSTLLPELKDAIVNIGVKTFEWIWYLQAELGLDVIYAEKIFYSPLGFVDEVKIFKEVWAHDPVLYKGEKPIFRIACILAQEEFVEKYQKEMIKELKRLRKTANLRLGTDKIYGIITIYLSSYIHQDLCKERKENYYWMKSKPNFEKKIFELVDEENIDQFDLQKICRNHLKRTGIIPPPKIMVKLCVLSGLTHGAKYFYKKLNYCDKRNVNRLFESYINVKFRYLNPNHYAAKKLREIAAFIGYRDYGNFAYVSSQLLFLCPLESIIWPFFNRWLKEKECIQENATKFLCNEFVDIMENCNYLELHVKGSLFPRLLKELFLKTVESKLQTIKNRIIEVLFLFCIRIHDFSVLRIFFNYCKLESPDEQFYFRIMERHLWKDFYHIDFNLQCDKNFSQIKMFYNQMFHSRDDRVNFFTEQMCQNNLLMSYEFEKWDKLYTVISFPDFLCTPLRDTLDPLKCLRFIASSMIIDRCKYFMNRWHSSAKNRVKRKNQFRASPYLPESIYKYWLTTDNPSIVIANNFLKWLLGSKSHVTAFKTKRLSIDGLLHASFQSPDREFMKSCPENKFHFRINTFISFCNITQETVRNVKEEIRKKMEKLMLDHAKVHNISTLNFLMDWVLLSEEEKSDIFGKLSDSSKMLKLCEEVLNHCYDRQPGVYIFYNNWLKHSRNISELKSNLISLLKAEGYDYFIKELSLMYEKLERGQDLSPEDICFDFI